MVGAEKFWLATLPPTRVRIPVPPRPQEPFLQDPPEPKGIPIPVVGGRYRGAPYLPSTSFVLVILQLKGWLDSNGIFVFGGQNRPKWAKWVSIGDPWGRGVGTFSRAKPHLPIFFPQPPPQPPPPPWLTYPKSPKTGQNPLKFVLANLVTSQFGLTCGAPHPLGEGSNGPNPPTTFKKPCSFPCGGSGKWYLPQISVFDKDPVGKQLLGEVRRAMRSGDRRMVLAAVPPSLCRATPGTGEGGREPTRHSSSDGRGIDPETTYLLFFVGVKPIRCFALLARSDVFLLRPVAV